MKPCTLTVASDKQKQQPADNEGASRDHPWNAQKSGTPKIEKGKKEGRAGKFISQDPPQVNVSELFQDNETIIYIIGTIKIAHKGL